MSCNFLVVILLVNKNSFCVIVLCGKLKRLNCEKLKNRILCWLDCGSRVSLRLVLDAALNRLVTGCFGYTRNPTAAKPHSRKTSRNLFRLFGWLVVYSLQLHCLKFTVALFKLLLETTYFLK